MHGCCPWLVSRDGLESVFERDRRKVLYRFRFRSFSRPNVVGEVVFRRHTFLAAAQRVLVAGSV